MNEIVARLKQRINVDYTTGCWNWIGAVTPDGYGRTHKYENGKRRNTSVHRVMYANAVESIPDGMFVCHRCDNPRCCNPEHLFLGTHSDNMNDMYHKGRGPTGLRNGTYTRPESRCKGEKNGRHTKPLSTIRGSRHYCAKLNEASVIEIRAKFASGTATISELAQKFGVKWESMAKVVKRKSWKHVA